MSLTFAEYEQAAGLTAKYPGRDGKMGEALDLALGPLTPAEKERFKPLLRMIGQAYCALGANGEAGEVGEKVKKLLRDSGGVVTPEIRNAIKKEVGDTLWYLAATAHEFDFTLEEAAQSNIDKLRDRSQRGVLHGSGDNR